MKSYYVEVTVSSAKFIPIYFWQGKSETYRFIIAAKNKKEGKALAKKRGMEEFERDLGNNGSADIKLVIDEFYQTCEDARVN